MAWRSPTNFLRKGHNPPPPRGTSFNSRSVPSNKIIQKGLAFAAKSSGTVTGPSRPDAISQAPRICMKNCAARLTSIRGLFRCEN